MDSKQYFPSLASDDLWSVFMEKWWQTLIVTFISAVIACCSVVWTLKMAAKLSENEVENIILVRLDLT